MDFAGASRACGALRAEAFALSYGETLRRPEDAARVKPEIRWSRGGLAS